VISEEFAVNYRFIIGSCTIPDHIQHCTGVGHKGSTTKWTDGFEFRTRKANSIKAYADNIVLIAKTEDNLKKTTENLIAIIL